MSERDPAWIERSRALLDASADGLDGATLSRLNRARQAAVAARATPARRWLPISGGVAAAAALGLALVVAWPRSSAPPVAPAAIDQAAAIDSDLELLGGDDNADLVQDMDFYAWLDAQDPQDG